MARGRSPQSPSVDIPLAGGGVSGGSLDIDTSEFRGAVRKARDSKKNLTVAGALFEDMLTASKQPNKDGKPPAALTQLADSLDRLAIEHEKSPGENLLEPYRQAMSRLADENPVAADRILQAIEAPRAADAGLPESVAQEAQARRVQLASSLLQSDPQADALQGAAASLSPEDADTLQRAQELQAAIQTGRQMPMAQEAAPGLEGMMQAGLAQDAPVFDDTRAGKNLVRQLAQLGLENPQIDPLIDAGVAYAPAPEQPPAPLTRGDFPVSLTDLMGSKAEAKKFFFEDREPGAERVFLPLIKPAHNIRLLSELSGRGFVPALPPESSTVGKLTKGRPGSKSAEGSVGDDYAYDVGREPAVEQALRLIDQQTKMNPAYEPDPMAMDASEGSSLYDPNALVIKKGFEKTLPHQIRQLLAGGPSGGRVMLRYGTSASTDPGVERALLRAGRSPLKKQRDAVFSVLEGTAKTAPRGLQRLIPSDAQVRAMPAEKVLFDAGFTSEQISKMSPAQLQETVASLRQGLMNRAARDDQAVQSALGAGGILPLEGVAPYFPAEFRGYLDPVDRMLYEGPLPPELLTQTIAQGLLLDDRRVLSSLEPATRRSMEIYQRFPAHGRMLDFMEGRDPTGTPVLFEPSQGYKSQVQDFYDALGIPMPEIQMRPNPLKRPGSLDFGMTGPRFQQTMNPLAALVG